MTDNQDNTLDKLDKDDPLVKKLQNEIEETEWLVLEPHYDRGALVFIDPQLDLLEVAVRVIRDEVDYVKEWTDQKLVYNPKDLDLEVDKSLRYRFVITQPYVLIQPVLKEN